MKKFFAILGAFVIALSCLLIPIFGNDTYAYADSTSYNFTFTSSNIGFSDLGIYSGSSAPSTFSQLTYYNANYSFYMYNFKIESYQVNNDPVSPEYNSWHFNCYAKAYNRQAPLYLNGSSYNSGTYYKIFDMTISAWQLSSDVTMYFSQTGTFRLNGTSNMFTLIKCVVRSYTANNSGSDVLAPTGSMTKLTIGNYTDNDPYLTREFSGYYNYLKFTDSGGWDYYFAIPTPNVNDFTYANKPLNYYTKRVYYYNTATAESDAYQNGYSNGYNEGLNDGNNTGYTDGYDTGYTTGYYNGHIDGINDSNTYSFFNLFGSVLDAPVSVLMGILNFQLLGINLWALFTGLLTLAVLIFVIKLFVGGK